MAEALAALGIASNVLQIVDFGTRLVLNTYKIVSSAGGALPEAHEKFAREQADHVKRLHGALVANPVLDDDERAAVTLAGQCKDESIRMLEVIEGLKVPDGKFSVQKLAHGAKIAMHFQKGQERIKEHRDRLQLLNGQLATTLLLILRYEFRVASTAARPVLMIGDMVGAEPKMRRSPRRFRTYSLATEATL